MIGILIIGDEILSGRRRDAHLAKSIELLSERGLRLSWARFLGDEPEHITAAVREALAGTDVVFSFGGIGATPDDHTRGSAAQAVGEPLVLHPEAAALILQRSRDMCRERGVAFEADHPEMAQRLNMGRFPQSATLVPNPYNQIPGFSLQGRVHFLPGFPVMAWPMMAWLLDERHAGLCGAARLEERSVIVYEGIESRLTPMMEALEERFSPQRVFCLPSEDHPVHGRHIELGIKGPTQGQDEAFAWMLAELGHLGARLGTIAVRK